jgi:DNA-directed RNA polymerase specialized sigma24 family protein
MIDKQLEVRKWLKRAFYADKKVKTLELLIRQCRERAERVSVCYEGNDKGKSSGCENGTEKALMKLADIELKAQRQKEKAADVSGQVWDAITLLHDDDLEAILIHRYMLFHTVEETAEIMNYDSRTVRRKQSEAIEKLVRKCPCLSSFDVVE